MLKCITLTVVGFSVAMLVFIGSVSATEPLFTKCATSLREQYADWTLLCGIAINGDTKTKICSMQQQQVQQQKDGQSQRLLAIDLQPEGKSLSGILVLPLGLKLEKGVMLQTEGWNLAAPTAYRTCLASGCIVDIKANEKMTAAMTKSMSLDVKVVTDDGKDATFPISLDGFQNALNRASDLLK